MRRKRNILENLKLQARRNPLLKPSVNRSRNKYNKEVEKAKKDYFAKKLDSCVVYDRLLALNQNK